MEPYNVGTRLPVSKVACHLILRPGHDHTRGSRVCLRPDEPPSGVEQEVFNVLLTGDMGVELAGGPIVSRWVANTGRSAFRDSGGFFQVVLPAVTRVH